MKNKVLMIFTIIFIYSDFIQASLKPTTQTTNTGITGHGNAKFYPVFKTIENLLKETQYPYNDDILLKASPKKQVSDSDIQKVSSLLKQLQTN